MSYLILPDRALDRLYDQPLALNYSHPGVARLVAGWYLQEGDVCWDLVRRRTGGKSGSAVRTRFTSAGVGFAKRTALGGYFTADMPEWARTNSAQYSILVVSVGTGHTSTTLNGIINTQQGAGFAGVMLREGDGTSNVVYATTDRDTTDASTTGVALSGGRRYCAVAVDQPSSLSCAVNGILTTPNATPSGSYNGTMTSIVQQDSARPSYLALCWLRALSQGEQVEYSARPDQLLMREPDVSYFLFSAAASSGTTISVPAGSIALTGYAPTVATTANQTIAVPAGSIALTGYAPTVVASDQQTIAVPAGSLTLTGYAPTVSTSASQAIQVPAGALTLTGYAPTVVNPVAVAVPAGSLTLTGNAPTVTVSAYTVIDVPAGAITLTGYAPTIATTANQQIAVPAGTLALTGYAPTVLGGQVWTNVSGATSSWSAASGASTTWTNA